MSADSVRARTRILFDAAHANKLAYFTLALEKMPALARFVADVVRQNYPALDVPFHARWRHFMVDGQDRWSAAADQIAWPSPAHKARAAFDLAIVSVLLDAGAGNTWRYHDTRSGRAIGRSEGLAIASLDMFLAGAFSNDKSDPWRADADKLVSLTADDIRDGFQVTDENPLQGVEGRVSLLNALGRAALDAPDIFASYDKPRPGGLFDLLKNQADTHQTQIAAPEILRAVLMHLGGIWPSRLTLGGIALGDTWRHPLIVRDDATHGLVPFHKLSQWLSYSLIEPILDAGITVSDIDRLTGLAEYRNGGLFIDGGLIVPRDEMIMQHAHAPGSQIVVEWRALTVALLDALAPLVRAELNQREGDFPLAKMLEGGTWAAGRVIARQKRSDGAPPLNIISDGTVF
ncbi:MAG: URC4/urg3 family protein [Beijerinckiaceae bacterium]